MENINLENITRIVSDLGAEIVSDKGTPGPVPELTSHKIEEYDEIEDNFIRYRVMVNDAIEQYEQARLLALVSDTGLSNSIYRMSEPFRKGHFTMAVVGKMSAGKSTFINALLGDNNLLPTGYFQTTCTLTTISHSEDRKLHVLFGDNREEIITENIGDALSRLVAIEPQYNSLPVNNINRLILNDVSKEDICSKKIIGELENLSKNSIDVELLKTYLDTHSKEDIPMEVAIECPLSENYRGWRIVDTPGVDAVGGIEDDTRKFLCGKDDEGNHNVDAIIFIQAAKGDLQSKSLNDFVTDTIGNLTEEAKKRAFFVLTHASNPDFIIRKDDIMKLAKQLFVDYAHVGDDSRLIAVDSLASLLEKDPVLDFKSLVKSKTPAPAYWDPEVWKCCRTLIQQVKACLEDDEEVEFNNENTRSKLHELANFETLFKVLNEFARNEKRNAFTEIIESIEQDIAACIAIREQDIRILQTNLGKSPQEFLEDLKLEKDKLDQFQIDTNLKFAEFSRKYAKSKIDEKFREGGLANISPMVFKSLPSLHQMREKAEEFGRMADKIADKIEDDIVEDVQGFLEMSQHSKGFVLPPIDYKNIASRLESKVKIESDKTYQAKRKKAKSSTGLFIRKRIGDIFGTDWGYEVWYETVHYTDMEQAALSFSNNLRIEMDNYRKKISSKIEAQIEMIDTDIKSAIAKRKKDYENMAENTDIVDQINNKNNEIEKLQNALSNFAVYHI